MKKILLTVLILTSLFPDSVHAQEKLQVGLKGGINISNFTGRGLDNHEAISRTSYHVGLLGQFSLASRWNLQPELLYSEQGFGFRDDFQEEIHINLNYLQLPVLVEFQLVNGFFVQSGPQLSYLLEEDHNTVSYLYNYNRFDLSIGFGADFNIQNLFIYGRYNTGINRIFNNSKVQTHNRVLQVGVGFYF